LRASLLCVFLGLAWAVPPAAASEWLELEHPSFTVMSQLDEARTRAWAVEFEQFIDALHELYDAEQTDLPPLTIVLFREPRDFAPYRLRTDSGQAVISGFFGHAGDWSVIGLPGGGDDSNTRQTIYHEAVHWFSTAGDTSQPLWLAEGLAEVLSTFKVADGKGRWGDVIEDNVSYLTSSGLLPMEDFLHASQDAALHGEYRDKYYPQAWAFVHYLLFGQDGADARTLAAFLSALDETGVDRTVGRALAKSYRALTRDLHRYLERGRYGYAEIELRDRGAAIAVELASETSIEFALGRLAMAGDNLALARTHANRVIALSPGSPAGYELEAHTAHAAHDETSLALALDRASELGSRDSWVYATQADRLLEENQGDSRRLDELLPAEVARDAADLYLQALRLRPRNEEAFAGLVMALLNVDTLTDLDRAAMDAGRRLFPKDGVALVGEAAAARSRGDVPEAARLLGQATAAPFTLPRRYRTPVAALRTSWFGEWLLNEVRLFAQDGRFAESRALVAEHLADETITGPLRAMLESLERDLPALEQRYAETKIGRAATKTPRP
jgi:hypothetical protein